MTRTSFAEVFPELAALEARCQEFELAHALGWHAGYEAGRQAAEAEDAAAWHAMWVKTRQVLVHPTFADLRRRREHAA